MIYACLGIGLTVILTLIQMLLPRLSIFALLALLSAGFGLYFGFQHSPATGLIAVAALLLVVPLAVYLSLLWMAPHEPQLAAEPVPAVDPAELAKLRGLSGVSITPIVQAGIARIAGRRVSVYAQTAPIAQDSAVVVTEVSGTKVVVRSA